MTPIAPRRAATDRIELCLPGRQRKVRDAYLLLLQEGVEPARMAIVITPYATASPKCGTGPPSSRNFRERERRWPTPAGHTAASVPNPVPHPRPPRTPKSFPTRRLQRRIRLRRNPAGNPSREGSAGACWWRREESNPRPLRSGSRARSASPYPSAFAKCPAMSPSATVTCSPVLRSLIATFPASTSLGPATTTYRNPLRSACLSCFFIFATCG